MIVNEAIHLFGFCCFPVVAGSVGGHLNYAGNPQERY